MEHVIMIFKELAESRVDEFLKSLENDFEYCNFQRRYEEFFEELIKELPGEKTELLKELDGRALHTKVMAMEYVFIRNFFEGIRVNLHEFSKHYKNG